MKQIVFIQTLIFTTVGHWYKQWTYGYRLGYRELHLLVNSLLNGGVAALKRLWFA